MIESYISYVLLTLGYDYFFYCEQDGSEEQGPGTVSQVMHLTYSIISYHIFSISLLVSSLFLFFLPFILLFVLFAFSYYHLMLDTNKIFIFCSSNFIFPVLSISVLRSFVSSLLLFLFSSDLSYFDHSCAVKY